MDAAPVEAKRRFRFSVRTFLLLVLIVGGLLGWVLHEARVQQNAVAAVRKAGGSAYYNWQWDGKQAIPKASPWAPQWLVDRIGVDYFGHVAAVHLDRGIRWGFFYDRRDLEPVLAHVGHFMGWNG